jgi:hypothetical protein
MDEVTQQNSAMVEENAATARTLEQQAAGMDERIGTFRLGAEMRASAAAEAPAAPVKRPAPARKPVARGTARQMQSALATAVARDEWEEF